jgi:hypothetical protein
MEVSCKLREIGAIIHEWQIYLPSVSAALVIVVDVAPAEDAGVRTIPFCLTGELQSCCWLFREATPVEP